MPTTHKTHAGPTKASKYPYRYQQDVQDRHDFRMKMKAELKAMAKESFLEEMEKLKALGLGSSSGGASVTMAPVPLGTGIYNSFDTTGSSGMARFQQAVDDVRYRQQNGSLNNSSLALDWSTSSAIKQSGPLLLSKHAHSPSSHHAGDIGLLTARTDPGMSASVTYGGLSPPQPSKKGRFPSSNKLHDTSAGANQMFVLSAAPIHTHEKLVHDQIHRGAATLDSSSLLEQANRYTELQSLFQPPAMTQELLFDPEHGLYSVVQGGSNQAEDEAEQRRQQQLQREKLEQTIAQHKERLDRSRQEDRYYHSGLLAKSAQTAAVKPSGNGSSRGFQNRGRRLVDAHGSPTSPGGGSPYSPPRSRSSSPQHLHHDHSHHPQAQLFPHDTYGADLSHPTGGGVGGRPMTSQQGGGALYPNRSNHSLMSTDSMSLGGGLSIAGDSVAHSFAQPPSSAMGYAPGGSQQQQRVRLPGASSSASVASSVAPTGPPAAGAAAAPMASSASLFGGHPAAPGAAAPQPSPPEDGKVTAEPSVMSVEDFQRKTDRLGDELRRVVRDAVHAEMVADGRARHYTKRVLNQMVKDKEPPLVDRIEKVVGDKIASLQRELDALKTKKLRRFRRKGRRSSSGAGSGGGKGGGGGGDNASVSTANDDDASFFGGYYDIDDDELPNWLKSSGEILHVLEKTQMNTGDPADPHHIDVRTLNSEINRAIEITLRRLLAGEKPDYVAAAQAAERAHSSTASEKLLAASDGLPTKSLKSAKSLVAASLAPATTTKVHGRIDSGKDVSKSTDTYGEFEKASTPSTSSAAATSSASAAAAAASSASAAASAAAAAAAAAALEAPAKPKKKSKAEKLLGIAGDGPGPPGPIGSNAPMSAGIDSASTRPAGSLFGQLGNLFSSKPTGPGISASSASSRPSMMMSMVSSRESTNGSSGGGGGGAGSMSNHVPNASLRPGRPTMMAPIIDEGDEETSNRSNLVRPSPMRPGGGGGDSAKKPSPIKASGGSAKKRGKGDDAVPPNGRSDSVSSLQSKGQATDNSGRASGGGDDLDGGDSVADSANAAASPTNKRGAAPMNPQLVAELSREEARYRELMQTLLSVSDVKATIKRELKDWERQFSMRTGRAPTAEDKATINDRYIAYKLATTQVQEAKDHVKACEDKLKEIRERAAADQSAAAAAAGAE